MFFSSSFPQTQVVESNVQNVAEALKEETMELTELTSDDIEDISEAFHNIAEVESNSPEVETFFLFLNYVLTIKISTCGRTYAPNLKYPLLCNEVNCTQLCKTT